MQNININDIYLDKNSTIYPEKIVKKEDQNQKKAENNAFDVSGLREINVNQPFYKQSDVKNTVEQLDAQLSDGQSTLERKNNKVLATSGMTRQDFSNMKADGFSPEELDEEGIVTVADKIRIQFAKAGKDISMMGDISEAAIKELGENVTTQKAIEEALSKASEITEFGDDAKRYIIKNSLTPTIENVHKANFSTSIKYDYTNEGTNDLSEEDLDSLIPSFEAVISRAGYAVTPETIDGAKWLINSNLPVTEKTIQNYMDYNNSFKQDKSKLLFAIYESVKAGKEPRDAVIIENNSEYEKAENVISKLGGISNHMIDNAVKNGDPLTIESISSQPDIPAEYEAINARRQVEEIRLFMSMEVNISMLRRGINIGTTELSNLIDDLRAQESRLSQLLFDSDQTKLEIFETTNETINSLKYAPVETLGRFKSIDEMSLRALSSESKSITSRIKSAGYTYETMMTIPRKDLGDSIKKAFKNIGDILEDLELEKTESNERAVRILGYNSLDINKDSVLKMRQADEVLQRTFKNLTPAVVVKMVKGGENPLDLRLDELNKSIEKLMEENDFTSSEDSYAEFLYKLDRQKGLSEEERNSYIGIYRLIHQVIDSDGAVIGALLNQGADITMRNMMTAIRSEKHKSREVVVDESFGSVSEFRRDSLTITEQIEMAFQTSRLRDTKEEISPAKLMQFDSEETYMGMSPDEFASALENMDDSVLDEMDYIDTLRNELRQALNVENRVYEELKKFDMPASAANLRSMESFLADRNSVYRKVFSNTVREEDLEKTPRELMGDIMHRFGEAIKTPEEMAKAQEELARTAENAMKDMLVEENIGRIDIQGMKMSLRQIRMLGEIAEKRENYTIPITIADENGTLNLKVVRGKDDRKGLVDIAFNMDKTGPVNATFWADAQGISGNIRAVKEEILSNIREISSKLEENIFEIINLNTSMSFSLETDILGEELYSDKKVGFETTNERTEVTTQNLYSIAKAFIDLLGEI